MDKGVVGDEEHGNHDRWEGDGARPYFGEGPSLLCNGEGNIVYEGNTVYNTPANVATQDISC